MKQFICIVCPRGCHLEVDDNLNVTGNSCKRGEAYGKEEATLPKRVISTTVKIDSVKEKVLPVKVNKSFPKSIIFDVMKEINKVEVKAPVHIGDVLLSNILGTGVDLVSAKDVLE